MATFVKGSEMENEGKERRKMVWVVTQQSNILL